jgi:phosphocarrier protein HPr
MAARKSEQQPPMTNDPPDASRPVEITNTLGMHLRTAAKFEELARRFQADVRVLYNGNEYNGKSIMSLLTMAAECGSKLVLECRGEDASEAVDALEELVRQGFHEDDEGQEQEPAS